MRRFFLDAGIVAGETVELGAEETRHLRDVLRLGIGDEASVFDGRGHEFACEIQSIGKRSAQLRVLTGIDPAAPESLLDLTVAATVIPGDKYDLIVQKSVELGVSMLIPMTTLRCEVKPSDAAKRLERWQRIAMEATKQCGRAQLMKVAEPRDFKEMLEDLATTAVLFSERDGQPFDKLQVDRSSLTILYGPKGGWDDAELDLARQRGVSVVTFGGRILRAETAAIAITAILQHRFGDMR